MTSHPFGRLFSYVFISQICGIGKERIRRAGDKIKAEADDAARNLDTGFRVLKIEPPAAIPAEDVSPCAKE